MERHNRNVWITNLIILLTAMTLMTLVQSKINNNIFESKTYVNK